MPSIEEVVEFIYDVADLDDLKKISSATSVKWSLISTRAAHSFRPGQRVSFTSRSGQLMKGRVVDTLKRNVRVKVDNDGRTWKVGATLLTAEA